MAWQAVKIKHVHYDRNILFFLITRSLFNRLDTPLQQFYGDTYLCVSKGAIDSN